MREGFVMGEKRSRGFIFWIRMRGLVVFHPTLFGLLQHADFCRACQWDYSCGAGVPPPRDTD